MTDTTFADSYITTDAILEAMIGADPRTAAVALKAAAAASQAWYCQEATRHIDALPFRGTKYDSDQVLEFPRIIDGVTVGNADQDAEVPSQVLWACLEEAIAILAAGSGSLKDLHEQGVQSMSIGGKLSYTFIAGAGTSGLQSAAANRYMRRYIGAEVR